MDHIILNPAVLATLGQFPTGVKICDDEGHVLGFFTPASNPQHYENVEMPQELTELIRRGKESDGRSLKDILADLERGF